MPYHRQISIAVCWLAWSWINRSNEVVYYPILLLPVLQHGDSPELTERTRQHPARARSYLSHTVSCGARLWHSVGNSGICYRER